MKPKIEKATAVDRALQESVGFKEVWVPGSKNSVQLIQQLSFSEVSKSSFPPLRDQHRAPEERRQNPMRISMVQWPTEVPKILWP
mmetsp:Transcript_35600/g.80479  ORF Transcript_35600/g.80479 Transcript_35600/m.80479 type:complete len:85 (+) Transcript_35600:2061-2315(+)